MIRSIKATNYMNESLTLVLNRPWDEGLVVRDISGLGPAKADINAYSLATIDGSRFVNSRLQPRNIVLTLSPIGTELLSVEDARLKVYRYFPIKQRLTFEVTTDNRKAYVTGYVESNEAMIFSETETLTVSIICPDPYFYESGEGETVIFSGIEPEFEFEFSNESLTDPMIEMSEIKVLHSKTIYYAGDAEVGVTMSLRFIETVSGTIDIYNPDTSETMTIDLSLVTPGIEANDRIEICTIKGSKYVRHIRGSTVTNIINALDRTSDWFVLRKGYNTIVYDLSVSGDPLNFSLIYRPAYQGV